MLSPPPLSFHFWNSSGVVYCRNRLVSYITVSSVPQPEITEKCILSEIKSFGKWRCEYGNLSQPRSVHSLFIFIIILLFFFHLWPGLSKLSLSHSAKARSLRQWKWLGVSSKPSADLSDIIFMAVSRALTAESLGRMLVYRSNQSGGSFFITPWRRLLRYLKVGMRCH